MGTSQCSEGSCFCCPGGKGRVTLEQALKAKVVDISRYRNSDC